MKTAYPVFMKYSENGNSKGYDIYCPDFGAYTCTDCENPTPTIYEAIYMARDLISLIYVHNEDTNVENPTPSTYEEALAKTKLNGDDEDITYSDGIFSYVDIDTVFYRAILKELEENGTFELRRAEEERLAALEDDEDE